MKPGIEVRRRKARRFTIGFRCSRELSGFLQRVPALNINRGVLGIERQVSSVIFGCLRPPPGIARLIGPAQGRKGNIDNGDRTHRSGDGTIRQKPFELARNQHRIGVQILRLFGDCAAHPGDVMSGSIR
jgi:hypothetical protein